MLRIYISTFNEKCYNLKPYMVPIEVGASKRENFIYPLRDDIGDNISYENDYYGELTGIYWIWKNSDLKPDDYIGFYHYNKYLRISEKEIYKKLKENDFIVFESHLERIITPRNNQRYYCDVAQQAGEDYYKYYTSAYMHSDYPRTCGGNLMITTKAKFDEYCEFLFPLIDNLRKMTGDDDEKPYAKRYCAFFSEGAFLPYLLYKNYSYYSCNLKFKGPIIWKINSFLIRVVNKFLPFDFAKQHDLYLRRSGYKK